MKKTLMIVTKSTDSTADYVLNRMASRRVEHIRLNSDKFATNTVMLKLHPDNDLLIETDQGRIL